MMHGHEKSDPAIVAVKPDEQGGQSVAEPSRAKGGDRGERERGKTRAGHQNRASVSPALERIWQVARKGRGRFTALVTTSAPTAAPASLSTSLRRSACAWRGWIDLGGPTGRSLSASSKTCMREFEEERTGRYRAGGFLSPSRTAGASARGRGPRRQGLSSGLTRGSFKGRRPRC